MSQTVRIHYHENTNGYTKYNKNDEIHCEDGVAYYSEPDRVRVWAINGKVFYYTDKYLNNCILNIKYFSGEILIPKFFTLRYEIFNGYWGFNIERSDIYFFLKLLKLYNNVQRY